MFCFNFNLVRLDRMKLVSGEVKNLDILKEDCAQGIKDSQTPVDSKSPISSSEKLPEKWIQGTEPEAKQLDGWEQKWNESLKRVDSKTIEKADKIMNNINEMLQIQGDTSIPRIVSETAKFEPQTIYPTLSPEILNSSPLLDVTKARFYYASLRIVCFITLGVALAHVYVNVSNPKISRERTLLESLGYNSKISKYEETDEAEINLNLNQKINTVITQVPVESIILTSGVPFIFISVLADILLLRLVKTMFSQTDPSLLTVDLSPTLKLVLSMGGPSMEKILAAGTFLKFAVQDFCLLLFSFILCVSVYSSDLAEAKEDL